MTQLVSRESVGVMPAVAAGLLAAFVGYASSVAVVIQGLAGVGATAAQVATGLFALGFAKGAMSVYLSWRTRMPISVAWSTPGAALLAGTGVIGGGFAEAVGAFLVVGALIVLAGLWKPLGRLVAAIPASIANAMLAGVIFKLCLAPFEAIAAVPAVALPVVLVWALVGRLSRYLAVPAAILTAGLLLALETSLPAVDWSAAIPPVALVEPAFSWQATVSIALPLFLVTMASQNITGLAVLGACGYRPTPGPLFVGTGLASVLAAPFGALTVNLAAITAVLCAGPEAHPDPARRWIAAVISGLGYIAFAFLAGVAATVVLAAPPLVIQAVAGLALLGALAGALKGALAEESERTAAVVAFLTTASGLAFAGIGSAFWGLLAGGALLLLYRRS